MNDPSSDKNKAMTLIEHLEELRKRIIYSLAAVALATIAGYFFSPKVLSLLTAPLGGRKLVVLGPVDGFLVYMKVSVFTGFFIALPFVLIQLWKFIEPALLPSEKKRVLPFVLGSMICFCGGVFFGYISLPLALKFLLNFSRGALTPMLAADRTISFLVLTLLSFGLVFQFPIMVILLVSLGILSPETLVRNRKYAVLGVVAVNALITPSQDIFTLLFLSIPLLLLYETSLWFCRFFIVKHPFQVHVQKD